MNNICIFSPCRQYRFTLLHDAQQITERTLCWIGLNPSTADEQQLDPTLRRIKAYSEREGFSSFCMLNVYPYRATDPKVMKAHYATLDTIAAERIAFQNASHIRAAIRATGHRKFVCAWGVNAPKIPPELFPILISDEFHPLCLGITTDGHPRHPLYLSAAEPLVRYNCGVVEEKEGV